jgi:hypothetical protein
VPELVSFLLSSSVQNSLFSLDCTCVVLAFFPCAKLSFLSSLHSVVRTSVLFAVSVKYYVSVLALSLVVAG